MATCHFCGGNLIWQNDFDTEDYGYEGEGVVAVLTCPDCNADWTGVWLLNAGEDK